MPEEAQISLEEARQHGTPVFPCAFYCAYDQKAEAGHPFVVPHHWHREFEMIHLERGEYQVEINMTGQNIRQECFCFLNSGELHHLFSQKEYAEQAVVFSPAVIAFDSLDASWLEIIHPLAGHEISFPAFLYSDHPAFPGILEEFHRIQYAFCRDQPERSDQYTVTLPSDQLRVKAALLNILALLQEYGLLVETRPASPPQIQVLKRALTYIRQNYQKKIYVVELARLANMNEQYFCRFFKKALGKTPVAYINEIRIHEAVRLLRKTELSVMEICLECGFHNLGHFMKEFRKSTGQTPMQLRKVYRNGD